MKPVWKQIKESPRLKENLIIRAKVISAVRDFFEEEGFLEMETPTLVASPDPSPFNEVLETKALSGERLFLTPSPEFFLKKLLVAGLTNIFEITKAYRDRQEKDNLHLTEFTILEWYRDNSTYLDLMKDCENLINYIFEECQKLNVKCQNYKSNVKSLNYLGKDINIKPPWLRISCKDAFKKYANIDLDAFLDLSTAREICQKKGYQVNPKHSWEELYHQIFLNEVEPKLPKGQPLFLYDYPTPLAALSKIKESDPRYAERFELYIGGLELGNGYSELTDWKEQEKRLKQDLKERKRKGMKVFEYNHEFVEALKSGIPKTAGIAVGIDRLVMLFTGVNDIHEVSPLNM